MERSRSLLVLIFPKCKSFNEKEGLEFGRYGADVFRKIEDLPMPVIAAINGFALGGGCELAMACDIRIASENAVFGQPEVKLGIIPGFSGTYRLSKLVGQGMAKELIYTGRNIKADEALRIGLVNNVVAHNELINYVLNLAKMIIANAPIAVAYSKRIINENYDMIREEALALENRCFAECFSTADQKEGMTAFLSKRPAEFKNQ
jgi:Enoyl-CoA hydratase/carnithine racemase